MFTSLMKWFAPKVQARESYNIRDPRLAELIRVTSCDPLSIPAVLQGVKLIADNCSKLNCNVYIKDKFNSREKDKQHQAYKVLRRPNSFQPPNRFFNLMLQHCLLYGNYYGRIYRNENDFTIDEIIPLDPTCTSAKLINGQLMYVTLDAKGNEVKLFDFEVLHVKGLMADAYSGHSIVELMSNAFGYSDALNKHGFNYFRNGASVKSVITMPATLWNNEAKRKAFMASWQEQHAGVDNSGKASFIAEGMTIDKLSMSNDEGQYLEARENDLVNVANILGVPAHFLGSKNSTSYSSTVEAKQALLDFCLDPWLSNIEQELEAKLLLEDERDNETRYIEFNRKKFVGMNAELEKDLLIAYYNSGLLSWEECRAKLNETTLRPDEVPNWVRPANILKQDQAEVKPVAEDQPQAPPAASNEALRATIERLGRRLERSNKPPLDHLEVFEQSLPHLKAECRDILTEINEGWSKETKGEKIALLTGELCKIM